MYVSKPLGLHIYTPASLKYTPPVLLTRTHISPQVHSLWGAGALCAVLLMGLLCIGVHHYGYLGLDQPCSHRCLGHGR